jgi:AraC-like DNA-binding protein/ligand-binding sensor protein
MKNLESILAPVEDNLEHRIIEQIQRLELYQSYERAFVEASGLPLRLVSVRGGLVSASDQHHRNPFCELLANQTGSCEACSRTRRDLIQSDEPDHHTSTCFAGLCESCIPIRTGGRTIGFLLTGQVMTEKATPARFARLTRWMREWGVDIDEARLRRAYFATPVMSRKHYRAILDLLTIFAGHLSLLADQLVLRHENSEAPDINRACEFIKDHLTEPLDLKLVAESANLSSCYFCKKFKESTGLTFTAYVARTRVEAAKKLLVNPQVRVSEVAFEVGFQSLTHFNRVFKEVAGLSPTQFRDRLPDMVLKTNGHRHPRDWGEFEPSGSRG